MAAVSEHDLKARPTGKAEDRIDARLSRETKLLIEHAAALVGVTTSSFVITQAYEAAKTVINEHEKWSFDRRQSQAFVENLLNPPAPNEALRDAALRYRSRQDGKP